MGISSARAKSLWTPERRAAQSARMKESNINGKAAKEARKEREVEASEARSSSKRRKVLETAAWWVFTHDDGDEPPNAATKRLQAVAKADPVAFMRTILFPSLPAPPKVMEGQGVRGANELIGGCEEALDEWWRRELAGGAEGSGGESGAPS